MVYRPECFEKAGRDGAASLPDGVLQRGLYRRWRISKGPGRGERHLWIPCPALKRLQGAALRLVAPLLVKGLPENVFGIGRRVHGLSAAGAASDSVFANAHRHLGQRVVCTFDIADFFPSTRINDILNGLKVLAADATTCVSSESAPEYARDKCEDKEVRWSPALRVFLARLGTRRGRLPQGSPLSPLLSSVAFLPIDRKIQGAIQKTFGTACVYSRYCDDLTFSISERWTSHAGMSRTLRPKEFQEELIKILDHAFLGTRYRTRRSKSKCVEVSEGAEVTGIRLLRDRLDVPRQVRRRIRASIHQLSRAAPTLGRSDELPVAGNRAADLASAAAAWCGRRSERYEMPVCTQASLGHRWKQVGMMRRRASAERLFAAMLRSRVQDLVVHVFTRDWYPWQEMLQPRATAYSNTVAWRMVEMLLTQTWLRHVTLSIDDARKATVRQGRETICTIEVRDGSLEPLCLERAQAVRIAEYWHHVSGLASYLESSRSTEDTRAISDLGAELREAITRARIHAKPSSTPGSSLSVGLQSYGNELRSTIETFGRSLERLPVGDSNGRLSAAQYRQIEELKVEARDQRQYREWLRRLSSVLEDRVEFDLPEIGHDSVSLQVLARYVHVCGGVPARAGGRYRWQSEVETWCGVLDADDATFTRAQVKILKRFQEAITIRLDRRLDWAELQKSVWYLRGRSDLGAAILGRLRDRYRELTSQRDATRYFKSSADRQLSRDRSKFLGGGITEEAEHEEARDALGELCLVVIKCFIEASEENLRWSKQRDKQQSPQRFNWNQILKEMSEEERQLLHAVNSGRNLLKAHHYDACNEDARKQQDRMRNVFAEALDRVSTRQDPAAETDCALGLRLTGYEFLVLRDKILRSLESYLNAVQRTSKDWQIQVGSARPGL
jgi:hypothetical protein